MIFKDWLTQISLNSARYPKVTLGILLCLTCVALFFCQKLHIDTSVTALIMEDNPDYIFFRQWQEQFGTDEFIIIAFENKKGIFQPSVLKLIKQATEQIEALPYVRRVISLANAIDVRAVGDDLLVEPLYSDEIPTDPRSLARIKQEALSNPLFVKNLISADGKATAIFVELEDIPGEDKYRQETIHKVEKICQSLGLHNAHFTGKTVRDYYLAFYMNKDLATFLPLVLGLIVFVLYVIFRSLGGILAPLLVIFLSLIWTVAALYLTGGTMNNVTTILPPVIMALSISDAVHLLSEYLQELPFKPAPQAMTNTIQQLVSPCLLTSTTTMAGFASLVIGQIPAIKQLGIAATIGIGLAFLITFTLLPSILSLRFFPLKQRQKVNNKHPFMDKVLHQLAQFNVKHSKLIIVATVLVVGISLLAVFRIKVETNLMEFFRKDTPIYKATLFMERHISGIQILEISLRGDKTDLFKDPKLLKRIEDLEEYLLQLPKVDKVLSLVDFLKKTNQAFHNNNPAFYYLPSSRPLIAQYLLLYNEDDLKSFVNSEYNWATVQVRLSEHNSAKIKKLIDEIKSYLKVHFPDLDTRITGNPVLEADIIHTMVSSQISSLALAFLIVFGMMFLLFRSISVGLISIVPNIFPIILNFGIMGIGGIPLNTATSMISAIAIGIVVDDTIHFLHTFGECLKHTKDYVKALYETIKIKGEAIVFTSVVLSIGFGILIFSNFVPTIHFGYLTTLVMITALIGDLVVLPVLLLILKPRFAQDGRKRK